MKRAKRIARGTLVTLTADRAGDPSIVRYVRATRRGTVRFPRAITTMIGGSVSAEYGHSAR